MIRLFFHRLEAFLFDRHPLHDSQRLIRVLIVLLAIMPITLLVSVTSGAALGISLLTYGGILLATYLIAYAIARVAVLIFSYQDREELFLEQIGEGVCGIDTQSRVFIWNASAERMSGLLKHEVLGMPFDHVCEWPSDNPPLRLIGQLSQDGARAHEENRAFLKTKTGSTIPVAGKVTALKDSRGSIIGIIIVFRDIAQEQKIDREKDEFVSFASHQLRTPLTNMMWRIEMLLDGDAGTLSREQQTYLEEVAMGTKRMASLVSAFLNVSRIHLGTLAIDPKPCDIPKLIDSVLADFDRAIREKSLRVVRKYEKKLPLSVQDSRLVQSIFQNLISNAVLYTPPKGKITLEAKKEESHLLISISDTGVGIPEHQQAKVFTKLFRSDNSRLINPDGNGLGLSIVKSLVDQSGGRIWFTSKEGEGSTFSITLPLKSGRKKAGSKALARTFAH